MTSTGRAVLIRGVMMTALALGAGGIPIGVTAQPLSASALRGRT
jgi:iron complex outermembrane receptor protein